MKTITFNESEFKLVPIEPTPEMLVALGGMGWMVQQKPESYAAMLAAAPTPPAIAHPSRDWELDCDHCNGSGHVFVKHQVAERATDLQEFKEDCECCEGRGFVFAFQDIPGIEEYVKSCRSGAQNYPITVSLDPDPRGVSVGVWQGSHCIYNGAHAVPSAQDDAKDERQAFEAWAKKKKMPLARIGQQYDDFWVDHAWNGWQARAALAAPAAGDARDDLTLNQKYEDACILANANARDAGRYRVVRQSIVDEANGSKQMAAASEAIGLERGAYPTPDQFDAIADHIAAQQGKGDEA